jgi:hypothetical protein
MERMFEDRVNESAASAVRPAATNVNITPAPEMFVRTTALSFGSMNIILGMNVEVTGVPDSRKSLPRIFWPRTLVWRSQRPIIVVDGYPRFQYGGFWFSVVDPWPEHWSHSCTRHTCF